MSIPLPLSRSPRVRIGSFFLVLALAFTLCVSNFTPASANQSFPRYFSETGFGIDNATIYDYFIHRGGLQTFGYPVSRSFSLLGFTTQIFQRRIVQLSNSGEPRLLNVLDQGLMPYSAYNGAVIPNINGELTASSPAAADQAAVLAFVKAYAPDTYQGTAVNFYQTFLNTVPYTTAFPNGGDASLLPGFDLELWGLPTSRPAFDPHNHNFIYLRFQRGVMMFDTGCGRKGGS